MCVTDNVFLCVMLRLCSSCVCVDTVSSMIRVALDPLHVFAYDLNRLL